MNDMDYFLGVKHGYVVALTKWCSCLAAGDGNFEDTISLYMDAMLEKISNIESAIGKQQRIIDKKGVNQNG